MQNVTLEQLADSLINELVQYDTKHQTFLTTVDRLCTAMILFTGGNPSTLKIQISSPEQTIRGRQRAEPNGPIVTDRFTPMQVLSVSYARPHNGAAMFTLDYFDSPEGKRDLLKRLMTRVSECYAINQLRHNQAV